MFYVVTWARMILLIPNKSSSPRGKIVRIQKNIISPRIWDQNKLLLDEKNKAPISSPKKNFQNKVYLISNGVTVARVHTISQQLNSLTLTATTFIQWLRPEQMQILKITITFQINFCSAWQTSWFVFAPSAFPLSPSRALLIRDLFDILPSVPHLGKILIWSHIAFTFYQYSAPSGFNHKLRKTRFPQAFLLPRASNTHRPQNS